MLLDHPCNHQSINRKEAERRLKLFGGDCYLIRYSEVQQTYVLSAYHKTKHIESIEHYEITFDNGKYKMIEKSFDSIESLLHYYESNTISPFWKKLGQCYTREEYKRHQSEVDTLKELAATPNEEQKYDSKGELETVEETVKVEEKKQPEVSENKFGLCLRHAPTYIDHRCSSAEKNTRCTIFDWKNKRYKTSKKLLV